MSFQESLNEAINFANSLGLPKLFKPTIPKAIPLRRNRSTRFSAAYGTAREPPRTPISSEVRSTFLPQVRIPPKTLITGGLYGAEPSLIPQQAFPGVVNGMWARRRVRERAGIKLTK